MCLSEWTSLSAVTEAQAVFIMHVLCSGMDEILPGIISFGVCGLGAGQWNYMWQRRSNWWIVLYGQTDKSTTTLPKWPVTETNKPTSNSSLCTHWISTVETIIIDFPSVITRIKRQLGFISWYGSCLVWSLDVRGFDRTSSPLSFAGIPGSQWSKTADDMWRRGVLWVDNTVAVFPHLPPVL